MLFDNRLVHQVSSSKFPIRRLIALNFFEGFSSYSRKYAGGNPQDYCKLVLGNYFDSSCIIEEHFGRVVPELDLEAGLGGIERLFARYYPRVRAELSGPKDPHELIESSFRGIQGGNLWAFKRAH